MHLSKISLALRQWGSAGFSPLSLFASGEQGVWFDPSDLSTMFQDSAGTTPVTVDGQPVGLILDKSKGLTLGPELVTNGDFSNGVVGWTKTAYCTLTESGGVATLTATAAAVVSCTAPVIPTVAGKTYKLTCRLDSFLGGLSSFQLRVGTTSGGFDLGYVDNATSKSFYFTATTTTSWVSVRISSSSPGQGLAFDNVSCKEIAGNHASQATAAARPLYKTDGTYHWLQFDGVDDYLSTAAIDFTVTRNVSIFSGAYKSINGYRIIYELGPITDSTDGSFCLFSEFYAYGRGTSVEFVQSTQAINTKFITTQLVYLQTLFLSLSINGGTPVTETGMNNITFSNNTLFIGSRNGAGNRFSGRIYSIIVRGALSTTQEITDTETWVNGKTRAY